MLSFEERVIVLAVIPARPPLPPQVSHVVLSLGATGNAHRSVVTFVTVFCNCFGCPYL